MPEGFEKLDAWIGRALAALEPSARARILRDAARVLIARQRKDIAGQRAPDGSPWPSRKAKKRRAAGGKPAVAGMRATIAYVNAAGEKSHRAINIRKVIGSGPDTKVLAFDERDKKLKTFRLDRVEAGLAIDDLKMGRVRKAVKMMLGLRQARRLACRKAGANAAEIGWTGRDARIASVHQLGGVDYVDRARTIEARYPARELLGVAPADAAAARAVIIARLAAGR